MEWDRAETNRTTFHLLRYGSNDDLDGRMGGWGDESVGKICGREFWTRLHTCEARTYIARAGSRIVAYIASTCISAFRASRRRGDEMLEFSRHGAWRVGTEEEEGMSLDSTPESHLYRVGEVMEQAVDSGV